VAELRSTEEEDCLPSRHEKLRTCFHYGGGTR
jgi:hypothetical protein